MICVCMYRCDTTVVLSRQYLEHRIIPPTWIKFSDEMCWPAILIQVWGLGKAWNPRIAVYTNFCPHFLLHSGPPSPRASSQPRYWRILHITTKLFCPTQGLKSSHITWVFSLFSLSPYFVTAKHNSLLKERWYSTYITHECSVWVSAGRSAPQAWVVAYRIACWDVAEL